LTVLAQPDIRPRLDNVAGHPIPRIDLDTAIILDRRVGAFNDGDAIIAYRPMADHIRRGRERALLTQPVWKHRIFQFLEQIAWKFKILILLPIDFIDEEIFAVEPKRHSARLPNVFAHPRPLADTCRFAYCKNLATLIADGPQFGV